MAARNLAAAVRRGLDLLAAVDPGPGRDQHRRCCPPSWSRWSAGSCCSRSPTAWCDNRVDVVASPRRPASTAEAQSRLGAAVGTDFDAGTQLAAAGRPRSSRAARSQGYDVVLDRPASASRPQRPSAAAAPASPRASSSASVPDRLRQPGRASDADGRPGPTRTDPLRAAAPASRTCPASSVGSQVDAARRRRHLRALLPLPDDRGAGHPRAGPPRAAHRRRPAAAAGRRA